MVIRRFRAMFSALVVIALGLTFSSGAVLAHNEESGTEVMTVQSIPEFPAAPAIFALAKITLKPGTIDPADPVEPSTAYSTNFVNAGVMDFVCKVDVNAHITDVEGPQMFKAGEAFQIKAGEAVGLPPAAGCDVANNGTEDVEVFVTIIGPYTEDDGTPEALPEGETIELLTGSLLSELPENPGLISSAIYTFAPSDALPGDANDATATTVYVGTGALDVSCAVEFDVYRAETKSFESVPANTATVLQAGDAMNILPFATCAMANTGTEVAAVLATVISHYN